MIENKQLPHPLTEGDKERASNSYLMSVVAIMAGMPIPLINLLATLFFLFAYRKASYFVRWHCHQAFISQLFLFFINTTTFWCTISIGFGSNMPSNNYFAYLIMAISFNIIEFAGTIYSAMATRKGVHLSWWFYGDLTDLIVRK